MFLSERITALAPPRALYFRLLAQRHDESTQVYPSDPMSYFNIGDSPYGVPSGTYTICFYTEQHQPMPHHNQPLQIDLQSEVHRANQSQLSLHRGGARAAERPLLGAGAVARPALNGATSGAQTKPQGKNAAVAAEVIPTDAASMSAESDLELRKHALAMDLEDRQQEFIKSSTYVTEVGEIFTLNRIMRRELMEVQRLVVLNSQQAYKETEQVKGTIRDLLELQREVLAHAAQTVKAPPASPPDYVGLGHSALATVRDLGVAMLQRSQPRESGMPSGRGGIAPQLPPAAREESASKPDIIDRLVSKIRSTTEADIAMAMSSPEKWKALLDELTAEEKKAPGPPPSASPESDAETRRK